MACNPDHNPRNHKQSTPSLSSHNTTAVDRYNSNRRPAPRPFTLSPPACCSVWARRVIVARTITNALVRPTTSTSGRAPFRPPAPVAMRPCLYRSLPRPLQTANSNSPRHDGPPVGLHRDNQYGRDKILQICPTRPQATGGDEATIEQWTHPGKGTSRAPSSLTSRSKSQTRPLTSDVVAFRWHSTHMARYVPAIPNHRRDTPEQK